MNAPAPDSAWVQVLDTCDMDQHAQAQQGWALQYEQLSPGQFKGRIHQVQLPEVTLLREDTSIALRQLRDEILMEWLEALPSQVDTSDLPNLERRKKLVDRACELMMGHADEPLSILEVCSRVGTSRRKLNYCFQDVLGTTPIKYLRSLRLNSVRRAIRQAAPGVTIQDIASHWGFWHLSQFAQDYKHLFGELPSDTLRQR